MLRPAIPFAAFSAIALAVSGMHAEGTSWITVGVAAAVAVSATLASFAVSPVTASLALPVAADLVVALLRQAQGGSISGYGPLVVLPVVWVALTLPRFAVAVMTVVTGLTFAVPIALVGAPLYPGSGWRGVVLWLVVAGLVGEVVNGVVRSERRHARLVLERQLQMRRLVATQTAIAVSDLDLDEAMALVAEEAAALTGAEGVVVELPDGDEMVYRAVAGTARDHLGLRLRIDETISGRALHEGSTLISLDTELDDRVDLDACRKVGARSLVVVPLLYDGRARGILKVYSPRVRAFTGETAELLTALANVIGTALYRAELTQQLREQATSDELTGLRNRRAFYEQLELALRRARRSGNPVSVVALDLDGLKLLNDTKGHAAGDRLLVEATSHWSTSLRPADILARVGGDEFALVLEGADEETAAEVASRLVALPTGTTASAGIATWNGTESLDALVDRADRAMYAAKTASRL
jgi:diguanylate cyclase (GGDEF)-like protein